MVPRFIVARRATSVSSAVFNKACFSRGETVALLIDRPVEVVVVVEAVVVAVAGLLEVCIVVQMEMVDRDVEQTVVGNDVYWLVCHTECIGLL